MSTQLDVHYVYVKLASPSSAVIQDEEGGKRVIEQQRKDGVLFQQKGQPAQSADIWALFMLMKRD